MGSTAASVAGSSVLILGFLVGVAGAAQTDCADSGVPARWLGGCLPASISNDIETGADNCVSVAREAVAAIYVNVFDDADTGDSDEFRGRLDRWRNGKLARSYRRINQPDFFSDLDEASLRAFHQANLDRYLMGATCDLEVLFLGCGESEADRQLCRIRMEGLLDGVQDSESLVATIAAAGAPRGSGLFEDVLLDDLAPELAELVRVAEIGRRSQVVETPIGLYALRVTDRTPEAAMPYEVVRERVLADVVNERRLAWIREETDRLADLGIEHPDLAIRFAQAARLDLLDQDPSFRRQEMRFARDLKAIEALSCDDRFMPTDEQIREMSGFPGPVPPQDPFRRWKSFVILIEAGADRYEAMQLARRVDSDLRDGDPSFVIDALRREDSGVEVLDETWLGIGGFDQIHPALADSVRKSPDSPIVGPVVLSPKVERVTTNVMGVSVREDLPVGFGFVVTTAVGMPPWEDVRSAVRRNTAETILRDPRPFLELLEQHWGLTVSGCGDGRNGRPSAKTQGDESSAAPRGEQGEGDGAGAAAAEGEGVDALHDVVDEDRQQHGGGGQREREPVADLLGQAEDEGVHVGGAHDPGEDQHDGVAEAGGDEAGDHQHDGEERRKREGRGQLQRIGG